jgi:Na+/phosphate symporter
MSYMLGAALFLIFFILIAPASRALVTRWLSEAGAWAVAWAPLSYIVLLMLIAAPFVSFYLMSRWPKIPDPENPLARYKQEDVEVD